MRFWIIFKVSLGILLLPGLLVVNISKPMIIILKRKKLLDGWDGHSQGGGPLNLTQKSPCNLLRSHHHPADTVSGGDDSFAVTQLSHKVAGQLEFHSGANFLTTAFLAITSSSTSTYLLLNCPHRELVICFYTLLQSSQRLYTATRFPYRAPHFTCWRGWDPEKYIFPMSHSY